MPNDQPTDTPTLPVSKDNSSDSSEDTSADKPIRWFQRPGNWLVLVLANASMFCCNNCGYEVDWHSPGVVAYMEKAGLHEVGLVFGWPLPYCTEMTWLGYGEGWWESRTCGMALGFNWLVIGLVLVATVHACNTTLSRMRGFQFGIDDLFMLMFATAVVLAMFQWFFLIHALGMSWAVIALLWLPYSIWKRQPSAVSSDGSNQG
ncbi:MAG: hypothetical protein N2C14_03670 [Planctomycetales bacterium]